MKRVYFFILFVFVVAQSQAQPQTWQWGYSGGGAGNDVGYAISTDAVGNSYATGRFNDTATFGTYSVTSAGGPDIFIAKYDSNGNCLWAKRAGSTNTSDPYGDESRGVDIDAAGNCYVTGNCMPQATFGSFTLPGNGQRQIYVAKYNSSGTVIWAKEPTGNSSNNYSRAIATDASGNSYITGYLGGGSNTFGFYTLNGAGAYCVKYDSSGNVLYATKLGSNGGLDAYGIDVDSQGNAYVTGCLTGTEIINSQSYTSTGMQDVFLIKINSSGNFIWLRQSITSSSSATAFGRGVSTDSQNNIYSIGDFDDAISFGSTTLNGPPAGSGKELFLVKYDSSGNFLWVKASSSMFPPFTEGAALKIDQSSNIYITGSRYYDVNFGSCYLPDVGIQTFITKYDSSGNCVFAISANGNSGARGYGISLDSGMCAYITGFSKAPVTFGNYTTTFFGGTDIFIAKLGCDAVNYILENDLSNENTYLLPNPSTGIFTIQSSEKISSVEIMNVLGEKVYSSTLNSKQATITLKVPNGIYFYCIISEEKTLATGNLVISP